MKTVGELRQLILNSGGELNIGKLNFKYKEGEDIDIRLDGDLIQWVESSVFDTQSLSDEDVVTVEYDFKNKKEKNNILSKKVEELEEQKSELEKEINTLKQTSHTNTVNDGKILAYEKILFGNRKVTVE